MLCTVFDFFQWSPRITIIPFSPILYSTYFSPPPATFFSQNDCRAWIGRGLVQGPGGATRWKVPRPWPGHVPGFPLCICNLCVYFCIFVYFSSILITFFFPKRFLSIDFVGRSSDLCIGKVARTFSLLCSFFRDGFCKWIFLWFIWVKVRPIQSCSLLLDINWFRAVCLFWCIFKVFGSFPSIWMQFHRLFFSALLNSTMTPP